MAGQGSSEYVSPESPTHAFAAKAAEAAAADRSTRRPPPRVLVLCGIPGSGKTSFAKLLEQHGWIRVNQDETGSRVKCESAVRSALLSNRDVVVDRCNFDVGQRKTWVGIGKARGCPIGAIVFRVPLAVCLNRVQSRHDHPTIRANSEENGTILRRIAGVFVAPCASEGIDFCRVVNEYTDMKKLGMDLGLL